MTQDTIVSAPPAAPSIKRCVATCTATSYSLKALFEALKARYKATLYRDVLHLEVSPEIQDIFCFAYGVVVFWGLDEKQEQTFLEELRAFEYRPYESSEKESMSFSFGLNPKIEEEEIILPDTDLFSRLAISHGLAQSVKLVTFENAIQKTIETTRHIPEQLASRGRIPLSKNEIRKKMGELFLERSYINLHSDILDVPEFFWEHAEVEPLYVMIANHLDLETRLEVLNARLDIVHELFEMLGNELNHQHSSRLEWIIIWLIVIEVLITLLLQYGP
jgi:uncharacterized Rmd1/YagE family protein